MGKIIVEIESYQYPQFEKFKKCKRVDFGDYSISHGIISRETDLGLIEGGRVFFVIGPGIPLDLRSGVSLSQDNYNRAIRAIEASRRSRIIKTLSDVQASYSVIKD